MYQLDKDILNLIFENLKVNLYPCLLVNKTWCETIVPIIWKNPWNDLIGSLYFKREKSLLKVIVSHIPDEKKFLFNNNYEIIKLIEAQKRLVRVHFELSYYNSLFPQDGSFGKVLENSLIKHSNTIQYFTAHRPISTEILSSLINLKGLELRGNFLTPEKWKNLENASLPSLQFLKLNGLPFNCIVSLIKNTSGSLVEIELCDYFYYSENEYKRIIQVIYQNCPNLKYFTFSPQVTDILETEKLLITCQFLNGLHIINRKYIDWDSLFKVLIKASPVRLYKFYFEVNEPIKLESLKYFIDNWKGRRPILLKIKCMYTGIDTEMRNLLKKYLLEGLIDTLYEW
ncbi:hypothetical protein GLOIN_2v1765864 [Rhizophagus clarus]|uniref:F-box domain-containing protein n=1 Tax=Rhizophagus clarus TaxID=94130 RepID=A0A8H3M772_9GLOM|nr:hypothetical protein GLOIN_2v1765864 [Rhizophagus clarus]